MMLRPRLRDRIDLFEHVLGPHQCGAAADHVDGRRQIRVQQRGRAFRRRKLQMLGIRDAEQVEAQDHVGISQVDAIRRFNRPAAQQQMPNHRAAFLRRSGLVERRDVQSLNPRSSREQSVDGNHSRAANAGHDDAIPVADRRDFARRRNRCRGQRQAAVCGAGRFRARCSR